MQKIYSVLAAVLLAYLIMPVTCAAATTKIFSGTVIRLYGSGIVFTTTSAATYSADIANAALLRKNGAAMQFAEILAGDKVEVKGQLWPDNGISPVYIKDNSLYAHTGTFTGKIINISLADSSFVIQSKTYGEQTIHTNNFTSFTKNGSSSGFGDLQLGMTTKVRGVWDRSNKNITASNVEGSFRMINIDFTGTLSVINGSALTVIGNGNVIYGVDAAKAEILGKNGKPVSVSRYVLGDVLRVWGKHISGMVGVTATKVKNLTR
jgi:hypothetical protein